jgi:hypothetical protein
MNEVTRILPAREQADPRAAAQLLPFAHQQGDHARAASHKIRPDEVQGFLNPPTKLGEDVSPGVVQITGDARE